jgi:hypothetical protein
MSCLSVRHEDGIFVTCANPIFILSGPESGTLVFEVFEIDSIMLKNRLGKFEHYGLDPTQPSFFGKVTNIEPCESTHPGLLYLREKPTLRVSIEVHNFHDLPSGSN